jgi:hypothetical protein
MLSVLREPCASSNGPDGQIASLIGEFHCPLDLLLSHMQVDSCRRPRGTLSAGRTAVTRERTLEQEALFRS